MIIIKFCNLQIIIYFTINIQFIEQYIVQISYCRAWEFASERKFNQMKR